LKFNSNYAKARACEPEGLRFASTIGIYSSFIQIKFLSIKIFRFLLSTPLNMATTLLTSSLGPLRRVILRPKARATAQTFLPLQSASVLAGPTVCSFSTTPKSKGDLVKELAETHSLKPSEAEKIINTVFDSIVEVSQSPKSSFAVLFCQLSKFLFSPTLLYYR
jgi:hypothetical protein